MKVCHKCRNTYSDGVGFCPHDGATLFVIDELQPGMVIRNRFRIEQRLGRGGYGEVYRVWHLFLNEYRALKVLLTTRFESEPEARALTAEARVLRQLQHPNIVRVEDVDETDDGRPFLIMEYVPGESVRAMLDREGCLSVPTAVNIAIQTCRALGAAHERGVLHRDIKPENLLVLKNPDGSIDVKVIDFGIAKVREDAAMTVSGLMTGGVGYFLGSAKYCSPEQAFGMRGDELDGRSDLYALGVVLFEMLTGALPFAADTTPAQVDARRSEKPRTLEQARPDLVFAKRIHRLMTRALERDRDARFSSASEMERELLRIDSTHEPTEDLAVTERTQTPLPRPSLFRPLAIIAGVIVLLVIAGFVISRQTWLFESPGVYLTRDVEQGQRVTNDALKQVGASPEGMRGEMVNSLEELAADKNCLVFLNALKKRTRLAWNKVGFCTAQ